MTKSGCAEFFGFIFMIIGMCTYLYGCNSYVGGLCTRYSTEEYLITDSDYYISGKLNYMGQNISCGLGTGIVYPTRFKTRMQHRDIYPEGSTHMIQFDTIDGYCKTESYVESLGMVGFVFLVLFGICVVYSVLANYCDTKADKRKQETRSSSSYHSQPISAANVINSGKNRSSYPSSTQTSRVHFQSPPPSSIELGPYEKENSVMNVMITNEVKESNLCGICENKFTSKDAYFRMECGHAYHKECMTATSNKNSKCVTCEIIRKDSVV
jgi:hypothetical protein